MEDRDLLNNKLKQQQERSKVARANMAKYKHMTYSQVLQEPENKQRIQKVEQEQQRTMESIIKKHYPHLKSTWKEEFALYWCGFLKGEYKSINHYLQRGAEDPNYTKLHT